MPEPITDETIARFVAIIQERSDREFAEHYPNVSPPEFRIDPNGKRYARIVQHDTGGGTSRSVLCFVDRTDGAIYYPAGWKGPSKKNPRGNVTSESHGAESIDGRGRIRMLR